MQKTAIAAFILALASGPAFAGDLGEAKSVCASAIASKSGKTLDGAATKLVRGRDGARTVVTVKVSYPDGSNAVAECSIRKGEVESVELKA